VKQLSDFEGCACRDAQFQRTTKREQDCTADTAEYIDAVFIQ